MRTSALVTVLTASLALAACGSSTKTPEAANTPTAAASMPTNGANMPMTQPDAAGQVASGQGTVTAVDDAAGTVTIKHGAIAAVNWPAMTMTFQAAPALRQKTAAGDKVDFSFKPTASGGELTAISKR